MFGPNANTISTLNTEFDSTNGFFEKYVVFTGTLQSMTRSIAMQKIADLGGFPQNSVTTFTDFVVMPNGGILSTKVKKAQQYGASVITEDQFLELLDSGNGNQVQKSDNPQTLSDLVKAVEELDEEAQQDVYWAIEQLTSRSKDRPKAVSIDWYDESVDQCGLLKRAPLEDALDSMNYSELRSVVRSSGLNLRGRSRAETIEQIQALDEDGKKIFLEYAKMYQLAPVVKKHATKLKLYLTRKFGREAIYDDESGDWYSMPVGAMRAVVETENGNEYAWTYPDSDVTRLLLKHRALPGEFDWYFDFLE